MQLGGRIDLRAAEWGCSARILLSVNQWCKRLTKSEAAGLFHDYNGGMTWIEGNMNWTRYNHALPPGSPTCKMRLTWDAAAMTANSNHGRLTHVLLGDGSVRAVDYSVSERVWRASGTIVGGERVEEQES